LRLAGRKGDGMAGRKEARRLVGRDMEWQVGR